MEPLIKTHPTRSAVIGMVYEYSPGEDIACLVLDFALDDDATKDIGHNLLTLQKHGLRPVESLGEEWVLAEGVSYETFIPADPGARSISIFDTNALLYSGQLVVGEDWQRTERSWKASLLAVGNFRFLDDDRYSPDFLTRQVPEKAVRYLEMGKIVGASVKRRRR